VTEVRVGLLGPVICTIHGDPVPIPGAKQRAVLATLALSSGRVVSVGSIVEALWSDRSPPGAEHSVQQHVSTIRKALRRRDEALGAVLVTQPPGYRLEGAAVDVEEFEQLAASGRAAAAALDWRTADAAFTQALALWRGDALVDTQDSGRLHAAATRLDEHRLEVVEGGLDARLQLGEHRAVVTELEGLVREHPLRERLRALQMLSLYRSGRQAEALAAYQEARATLVDGLGIEPGPELRELEQAILEQRPGIGVGSPLADADLHATYRADSERTARLVFPNGEVVVLPHASAIVGRDANATVRLIDSRVSRRHAELVTSQAGTILRDFGSTNGTTLNDVPVEQAELRHGDIVSFGGLQVEFLTD
jgi:DNA-binding SARP family transcriptional activator